MSDRIPRKLIVIKNHRDKHDTLWLESILKHSKNMVRVSKYELRNIVHGNSEWLEKRENIVFAAHLNMIEFFMEEDKDIMIDDLAVSDRHVEYYKRIAEESDYDFIFIDCKEINGFEYKPKQQNQDIVEVKQIKEENLNYVIYPFEGGVCINTDLVSNPQIDTDVAKLMDNDVSMGYKVYVVSKGDEGFRSFVENWLLLNCVLYHELFMTPMRYSGQENQYKVDLVNQKLKHKHCMAIYESDEDVLAEFKEIGLHTVDLNKSVGI